MSQASPLIGPNKSGLTYRQEDNDGKQALLTHHKGASAPAYAEAGTLWLDDAATPWLLKIYDGVDWICLSQINAGANTALPYIGQEASRGLRLHADTGGVNAYEVTMAPAPSSYSEGLTVLMKASTANTGTATLAVNGLTATAIKMPDGTALVSGAIHSNGIYILCHDGANFRLLNPSLAQTTAILQTTVATYSGNTAMSSVIPADDTIPTATEGSEIISVSITPKSTTSKMVIRALGMCATSSNFPMMATLVVHGESSAFAVAATYTDTAAYPRQLSIYGEHAPGSLSPIIYKLRLGANAGSIRANGSSSGRQFGGIAKWMMTVEEYAQ